MRRSIKKKPTRIENLVSIVFILFLLPLLFVCLFLFVYLPSNIDKQTYLFSYLFNIFSMCSLTFSEVKSTNVCGVPLIHVRLFSFKFFLEFICRFFLLFFFSNNLFFFIPKITHIYLDISKLVNFYFEQFKYWKNDHRAASLLILCVYFFFKLTLLLKTDYFVVGFFWCTKCMVFL